MAPILLFFFFSLFKIANFEQNKPDFKKATLTDEDRAYKISKYFPDGSCGILEENGFGEPKKTEYSQVDFGQFKCIEEFHRFAMVPKCGDAWFDLKKYCAQVRFYENKEPKESWVYAEGNEDVVMVVLDGCIKCKGTLKSVKLTLKYKWPSGSFFTKCSEQTKTLDDFSIQIASNKSFTLPAVFYHRKCMGFFSHDSTPPKYEQIKLEVEHDCGGNAQNFEVNLPDLEIGNVPENRVAEFHFLELNLDEEKAQKYKGPEEEAEIEEGVENANWDFEPFWKK